MKAFQGESLGGLGSIPKSPKKSDFMPRKNDMESEVELIWSGFATGDLANARRVDIKSELTKVRRRCIADTSNHLGVWITLADETLHYLHHLFRFVSSCFERLEEKAEGRAFLMLVARVSALSVAVRRLVADGLEDAARPVLRSLLETLDLALVTLVDREFADQYDREPHDYDINEFWKQQIGFGRLNKRLLEVLTSAGLTELETTEFLERRAKLKLVLSGAAHGSIHSAFRSFLVPSLARPGWFRIAPFGHVSSASPYLLYSMSDEVVVFGAILGKLMSSDTPPPLLGKVEIDAQFASNYVAFFTLQELVERYEKMLAIPDGRTDE
ncbi:MAG TPA: hypothetical protein VF647_07110 [Longimicrobium sp.]